MVSILHCDGFAVIGQSLCFLYVANVCRFFPVRALVLVLAFADFALGLNLLGVGRFVLPASWYWLRLLADSSGLMALSLYLVSGHMPAEISRHTREAARIIEKRLFHW